MSSTLYVIRLSENFSLVRDFLCSKNQTTGPHPSHMLLISASPHNSLSLRWVTHIIASHMLPSIVEKLKQCSTPTGLESVCASMIRTNAIQDSFFTNQPHHRLFDIVPPRLCSFRLQPHGKSERFRLQFDDQRLCSFLPPISGFELLH